MEAKAVNSRGVYIVGSDSFSKEQGSDQTAALNNSLMLYVSQHVKNGDGSNFERKDVKMYDFDQIRDLQSKLVLIGGKQRKTKEQDYQVQKDCFNRVSMLYNSFEVLFNKSVSSLTQKDTFLILKLESRVFYSTTNLLI